MIILALLAWFVPGFPLEMEVELGWSGRPVLEAVNPLWIQLRNTTPEVVVGELWVRMEYGSPWRGGGTYSAVVPFAVGAFSRARLLLPWPVRIGASLLQVWALADGAVLVEREEKISPEPGPLRAGIGPPQAPLDLFLSPAELPADPLLLSPFSELRAFTPLDEGRRDLLRAWELFLHKVGVDAEALRAHLSQWRPPAPRWEMLVPGIFLYLLVLSFALPPASRGDYRLILVSFVVFCSFSLIYIVWRGYAPPHMLVEAKIHSKSVNDFHAGLLGIVSGRGGEKGLPGWWMELLPPRGWTGHDVLWRFGEEGWRTELRLEPGVPRIFWRIAPEYSPPRGEALSPPGWLQQSLLLPWKEAQVHCPLKGETEEVYFVSIP